MKLFLTFISFSLLAVSASSAAAQITGVSSWAVKQLSEDDKIAVGFQSNSKLTKIIETPLGPKEVYDPLKDPKARAAFQSLYDWARQDGYFQTQDAKTNRDGDYARRNLILERYDARYIDVASRELLSQYANLGCDDIGTRICRPGNLMIQNYSCRVNNTYSRPFFIEMVGDPKREFGVMDVQYEMFFEASCNRWKVQKK